MVRIPSRQPPLFRFSGSGGSCRLFRSPADFFFALRTRKAREIQSETVTCLVPFVGGVGASVPSCLLKLAFNSMRKLSCLHTCTETLVL